MILLASPSQDIYARWKQGAQSSIQLSFVDNMDALKDELVQVNPSILLLNYDLPNLGGPKGIPDLIKLSPETRIIILCSIISDENEWELFKAGVRGCCPIDIDAIRLIDVINAVRRGELWIRRSITCRLLDELAVVVM